MCQCAVVAVTLAAFDEERERAREHQREGGRIGGTGGKLPASRPEREKPDAHAMESRERVAKLTNTSGRAVGRTAHRGAIMRCLHHYREGAMSRFSLPCVAWIDPAVRARLEQIAFERDISVERVAGSMLAAGLAAYVPSGPKARATPDDAVGSAPPARPGGKKRP